MKLAIAASAILAQSVNTANAAEDDSQKTSAFPLLDRVRHLESSGPMSMMKDEQINLPFVGETLLNVRAPPSSSTQRPANANMFAGILQNLQNLQDIVECDPSYHSSSRSEDADVGILSCGVGRYCAESAESSMGGLCKLNHWLEEDDTTTSQDNRRSLQGDTILSELQYACDYAYLIGYECTCNLDAEAYSGTAVCTSPTTCSSYPSACNVNSTDCRANTYTVTIQSPGLWETELCTDFTAPYNQQTCYSLNMTNFGRDVSPECSITFDGQVCNSCEAYSVLEQSGNETYPSDICYLFDCSNTGSGLTGNTCQFPVSTISLYLDTYGCPPCNVCGQNGTMMSPETSVRVLNNTYQCGYIQDVSLMGFFTDASCQYFSNVVNDPCQCQGPLDKTEAPATNTTTVAPTEEATAAPTNATGTQLPVEICEPCPNGSIMNPDGLVTVPGSPEQVSCTELAAAGTDGSIPSAVCPTVQDLAAVPCCGKEESTPEPEEGEEELLGDVCNPCGPNREMTKIDGVVSVPKQGMFTCQELAIMGRVAEEDEDWCVLVRPFVQTPCGCKSTVPTAAPTLEPTANFQVAGLEGSGPSRGVSLVVCVLATATTLLASASLLL